MSGEEDIKRVQRFAFNRDIILPCDDENLPCSIDSEDDQVIWMAFESRELGIKSQLVDTEKYRWGMMVGLDYLKYLHERVEQGGNHILVVNPSTSMQFAMNNQAIVDFLEWLDAHPDEQAF